MSLENLADINFCNTDTETIEQSVITVYEGIMDTTLYPGDPVRLFLESLAVIIVQQRQLINDTGKQNLLKYADGNNLDHLGSFTKTARLIAATASTIVRFNIDHALGFVVAVPQGTRVSPDGQLFFATSGYAEIKVGNLYVDITVTCQTSGDIGNGFLGGQINKLVDPLDYISSVSNITTSSGGADEEGDGTYRERIHTAPESFSVAGPSGAYQHWVKSAHQNISDVAVYRTSPLDDLLEPQLESVLDIAEITYAELSKDEKKIKVADWLASAVVNVCLLLDGGEIPEQTMLNLVDEKLNDRTIRPLTDRVMVAAPTEVPYNIDLTYYIAAENKLVVAEIQSKVTKSVDEYIDWQKGRLGRDINPAQLTHLVIASGAHRVEIVSPLYASVGVAQVAKKGTISLAYGGLEDE